MTFRLFNTNTHHTLLVAVIAACIFVGLLYLSWEKGNATLSRWRNKPGQSIVPIEPHHHFDWRAQTPKQLRPFKPTYNITMGIQADDLSELITIDQDYLDRVTTRRSIVSNYKNTVHGCLPGGETAVKELYSYLLGHHLPTRFPSMFKTTGKGSFQNTVTGATFPLSPPSDPEICLRTLAETVEEDIFLLKETDTTHVCLAFTCCFPTGFDPSTKLGQDLKGIHDPVPSYEKIGPSMERFFRKLQVGKSVKRMNWVVQTHGDLINTSGNHIKDGDEFVADEEAHLRIELQTLTRLPQTRFVLFCFKTYLYPLKDVKEEGSGPALADAIEGLRTGNAPGMFKAENAALSRILERLDRIEQRPSAAQDLSSSSSEEGACDQPPDETAGDPSARSPESRPHADTTYSPNDEVFVPQDTEVSNVASPTPWISNSLNDPDLSEDDAWKHMGNTSILEMAIKQVQARRKAGARSAHRIATEGVSIPPELARTWMQNYFAHMSAELFLTLVDRRLLEMMPDLVTMRHVHLDACMLLIYYAILWQGCFLPGKRSFIGPDRNWQRESAGSVTDLVAALYMMRTAAESFDFETALEMHNLACEYAEGLQMHNLDRDSRSSPDKPPSTDDDRKGMWELIQMDLFYRLIYNKPAAFSSSIQDWRVNLPWLSVDSPPDNNAPVPTMTFILRSRLALILASFFQLLDDEEDRVDAVEAFEPLCQQIEDVFQDWKLHEWIQALRNDHVYTWILVDLALAGYTSILFMLRKAMDIDLSSPGNPSSAQLIPLTETAMRASRRILELIYHMLHEVKQPGLETLSLVLGTFRAHLAYSFVANYIISSPDPRALMSDFELLERVASCVETVAKEERDFTPLARALVYIHTDVKKRRLR
ncbi:hypothetical protein NCS56_01385000 [Fusarium sp. Ph1]|nr:hypothetical protein NCS56_01385000 [Fusarium sp. Ph1]